MKRKLIVLLMLLLCLMLCSGCSVQEALREVSNSYQSNSVSTPTVVSTDTDWSFVPLLRERSESLFLGAAPQATIVNSIVTTKNADPQRVIVVIEYSLNDKNGTYGFDYKLENGEYTLSRYGEGVTTNDIH